MSCRHFYLIDWWLWFVDWLPRSKGNEVALSRNNVSSVSLETVPFQFVFWKRIANQRQKLSFVNVRSGIGVGVFDCIDHCFVFWIEQRAELCQICCILRCFKRNSINSTISLPLPNTSIQSFSKFTLPFFFSLSDAWLKGLTLFGWFFIVLIVLVRGLSDALVLKLYCRGIWCWIGLIAILMSDFRSCFDCFENRKNKILNDFFYTIIW